MCANKNAIPALRALRSMDSFRALRSLDSSDFHFLKSLKTKKLLLNPYTNQMTEKNEHFAPETINWHKVVEEENATSGLQ